MKTAWWIFAVAGPLFVGWAHDHTDELPIVLGFVLILGTVLGALAPQRFLINWALIGGAPFVVELLVHYRVIGAPYEPSAGIPFVALFAYIPALLGVALGAGVRRITMSAVIP